MIGNGDIDSSNGGAGANPSNAFMVKYDGSATLSGDLTIESDARLKSIFPRLRHLETYSNEYTLKSDKKEHTDFSSRNLKVFPELVKE